MTDSLPDDARLRATETQMRRALGLDRTPPATTKPQVAAGATDTFGQRRRFARDGDVPVTVVHRSHGADEPAGGNQLDAARQALRAQTTAREEAERLLAEAQATIRDLQTKLAHERMAREEARQQAEARLRELEQDLTEARAEIVTEREQREAAEAKRSKALASLAMVVDAPPRKAPRESLQVAPDEQQPRRRGRPPKVKSEPEPDDSPIVEWWVPGWRDKLR